MFITNMAHLHLGVNWSVLSLALSIAMSVVAIVVNQAYTFSSNHALSLWCLAPLPKSEATADRKRRRQSSAQQALSSPSCWHLANIMLISLYFFVEVVCVGSLYNAMVELTFAANPYLDVTYPWLLYVLVAAVVKGYLIGGKSRSTWIRASSLVRLALPASPTASHLSVLLHILSQVGQLQA